MSTTEHPLTDTAAEVTNKVRNLAEEFGDLIDDVSTWGPDDEVRMLRKLHKIRAALSAALAVAPLTEPLARTLLGVPEGHGAPHHDAEEIKPEDFVMQVDRDGTLRGGRAHRQNEDGDWFTEDGVSITWAPVRADRPDALTVWPAPTPPAEEVEMPGEPRRLTDVELSGGETIAEATWTGAVLLYASHPLATTLVVAPADQIEQWTLDGTRAVRDGDKFYQEAGE